MPTNSLGNVCIIGANAKITERMVVPDGSMVLGSPGKITKTLPVELIQQAVQEGVNEYVNEAKKYLGVS